METLRPLLAETELFHDLDQESLDALTGCAANVSFESGHVIFREGQPADRFYLLREGRIALEAFSLELGGFPLHTLDPGDVVGWSWLVPPHKWRFDGRCLSRVRAFAFDGSCLRGKCMENPRLGFLLLQRFAMLLDQRMQAERAQFLSKLSTKV